MPTCVRCGEWCPPSRGDRECPVCGGALVSDETANQARRDRALEEKRFHELRWRPTLTIDERSEFNEILDQRAARKGMSRSPYVEGLQAETAAATEAHNRSWTVVFVLIGIVWLAIVEIGTVVVLSQGYLSAAHEEWKNLLVAGVALITAPLVGAGATWLLEWISERAEWLGRWVWPGGVVIAWIWARLVVVSAGSLLP
jgi:hypothetical protein